MASTSGVKLKENPAEKMEKNAPYVSSDREPQIKVELESDNMDMDDTSMKTEDTNTKSDDASSGTDDNSAGNDDTSTGTDDASTGTDETVYAPDGGWGWMVTMAGFVVAFIVDGIVASFGLLLPELLTTYDVGVSLASFPPAILCAMYLFSGPLTAYLVKRWGCRKVGFCGGLVAALGIAGSAYAPNIQLFILCFGFVAGLGSGLIYLPSVTMINVYFHKKRGIVAGIITSGSGFGLLALAPLTEMLMEEYGWRGCYLIMAAISLHFCVCASLMRPLHSPPHSPPHTADTVDSVVVEGREVSSPLLDSGDSLSLVSVEELDNNGDDGQLAPTAHLEGGGQFLRPRDKAPVEGGGHSPHLAHKTHHGSLLSSVKNLFTSHHVLSGSHVQMTRDATAGPKQFLLTRSRSHGHLESRSFHRSSSRLPVNVLSTWLACQVPPSLSRHTLHSHQSSDKMAHEHGGPEQHKRSESSGWQLNVSSRECAESKTARECAESKITWGQSLPSVHHNEDVLRHVVMKSQLRVNGLPLIPNTASDHKEKAASYSLIPNVSSSSEDTRSPGLKKKKRSVAGWVRENRVFMLFLVGSFLIQLVCNVPPLLAPSYAYGCGVSKEEVATILSIYGLLNTVGRLLAGVLVYWGVRTLHVYNVGTVLAGLACFLFPLCTSFPTIALCLGLHGFFLGAFPPLQSVILVEYLGLHRLTSTFGTMCLIKAFASAAGAPLAGLLFTMTGTYTVPVAVCGAVLGLAAIFHQMMDCWG